MLRVTYNTHHNNPTFGSSIYHLLKVTTFIQILYLGAMLWYLYTHCTHAQIYTTR